MWPEHLVLFAGGIAAALCLGSGFAWGRWMSNRALDVAYEDGHSAGWGEADEAWQTFTDTPDGTRPIVTVETTGEFLSAPLEPGYYRMYDEHLSPGVLEAAAENVPRPGAEQPRQGEVQILSRAGTLPVSPYAGELTPAQRRRDKHKRRGQYAPELEPGDDTLTNMFAEFGTWEQQIAAVTSEGQTPWLTAMLQEVA